jgi:hypothetical protein
MREDRHEMEMAAKHPSGAEEWHCPTCGRRFLMQWPPAYKKIVLEPGDEHAIHSGSKGGISISRAGVEQFSRALDSSLDPISADLPEVSIGDEHIEALKPWMKWINNTDFDNSPNAD